MNTAKQQHVYSYFNKKIVACKAEANALELDDRRDEAVFVKVRLNIYDVFRTVFSAAINNTKTDEQLVSFFRTKMDQIPRSWHASLQLAQQHGDVAKAHIEEIKLDTVTEIRNVFESIWEVEA